MSVLGGLAIKPLVQAIRIAIRKKLDPWQRTGFGVSTVLEVPYPWRRTVTGGRSAWTRWAGLVYLFLKLYLYLRGQIFLDVPANGLLLLLLFAPVPRARWEPWRAAVVAIVALGLARYEILPAPMGAAVSFLAGQPRPSIAFVWQFLRDYFGVVEAVGLFLAVPLCLLAWRRPVPAGAGALVLLLAAAANQNVTGGSRMRQSIDRFYAEEATRGVEFQASS
jgi:hypothetical protein